MRIALCHQTFAGGDAIGRDIVGMCAVLTECGHRPFILCECDVHKANRWEVSADFSNLGSRADLIIYHHSQDWPVGRTLLESTALPVIFKFHNITPPQFFAPYAPAYEERCRSGEIFTQVLARWTRPHLWLSDSVYNQAQLQAAGVTSTQSCVVPPFNNADALLRTPNIADTGAPCARFLFAGRFAPNKAHRHLVRFAAAYRQLFGTAFEVVITGAIDPTLRGYWEEFTALVRELDLVDHVKVYPHLADSAAHALFRTAHAYLTFSEHEGFCVPVIEAQAIGLPVIGSGATAVRETAGPAQFLGGPPTTAGDYEFYAELAHLAARDPATRAALIATGRRNVLTRFTQDVVENAFLEAALPWLHPRP